MSAAEHGRRSLVRLATGIAGGNRRRISVSPAALALTLTLGALVALAAITTPSFLTTDNLRGVIGAAALTGIAAIGLTFVTLSGNFVSLSVEQTAAAVAVALALLLSAGWPVVLALPAVLALAVAIGIVQGATVGLGANPIIVTLGAGAALHGLTTVMSGGKLVRAQATGLDWLGGTGPFNIPMATYAFVVVAILATIYLHRRRSGQQIALTGENREAAAASGISVLGVAVVAFVISSLAAAVVAILSVSAFDVATVDGFSGLTFNAIAAVLVGGTAITGGEGSPARTAMGAVFIAVLANVMLLHDFSFGVRLTVQGLIVVVAVCVYHLAYRRRRVG